MGGLGGGCPSTSFGKIKIVADTAWGFYRTAGLKNFSANNNINIYPNPAHDNIIIEGTGFNGSDAAIMVFNTLGQMVKVPVVHTGGLFEADVRLLPGGWYYVVYRDDNELISGKFLKE